MGTFKNDPYTYTVNEENGRYSKSQPKKVQQKIVQNLYEGWGDATGNLFKHTIQYNTLQDNQRVLCFIFKKINPSLI